jgi:predicted ATP-dependent protease
VLAHLSEFVKEGETPAQDPLKAVTGAPGGPTGLDRYRVNVVVDNSKQVGAPVIVELNPSYKNLIGSLEREVRMGTLYTDYTMIRAGSALRASGGFLILDIADVLMAPFAERLKRVLTNCESRSRRPRAVQVMACRCGRR